MASGTRPTTNTWSTASATTRSSWSTAWRGGVASNSSWPFTNPSKPDARCRCASGRVVAGWECAMGEPRLKRVGIIDVRFGDNVTVVEPANLYGCEIGDGCFIGPFVEIQKDVKIGARTRVQSHSFVC